MTWLWVTLGGLALTGFLVWAAVTEQRARDARWAVRYLCPGCEVRYEADHDNRFFLPFEVCPGCGTDKGEFDRQVCRFADGEWQDRAAAEAVARAVMGED